MTSRSNLQCLHSSQISLLSVIVLLLLILVVVLDSKDEDARAGADACDTMIVNPDHDNSNNTDDADNACSTMIVNNSGDSPQGTMIITNNAGSDHASPQGTMVYTSDTTKHVKGIFHEKNPRIWIGNRMILLAV